MQKSIEQLWCKFWRHTGAQGDPDAELRKLTARYSEPHRAYHTLEHIRHCLGEFEHARNLAADSVAVELALWYHDVIYDTRAKDNEEKSASFAKAVVRKNQLPDSLGQAVARLIMATKHAVAPAEPDEQLIVDIDLSILGQSDFKFDNYERQIRTEYEWVPTAAFVAGRSAILESFLNRPAIFSTQFFQEKYEAQARHNIRRSLAQLSHNA